MSETSLGTMPRSKRKNKEFRRNGGKRVGVQIVRVDDVVRRNNDGARVDPRPYPCVVSPASQCMDFEKTAQEDHHPNASSSVVSQPPSTLVLHNRYRPELFVVSFGVRTAQRIIPTNDGASRMYDLCWGGASRSD